MGPNAAFGRNLFNIHFSDGVLGGNTFWWSTLGFWPKKLGFKAGGHLKLLYLTAIWLYKGALHSSLELAIGRAVGGPQETQFLGIDVELYCWVLSH